MESRMSETCPISDSLSVIDRLRALLVQSYEMIAPQNGPPSIGAPLPFSFPFASSTRLTDSRTSLSTVLQPFPLISRKSS